MLPKEAPLRDGPNEVKVHARSYAIKIKPPVLHQADVHDILAYLEI